MVVRRIVPVTPPSKLRSQGTVVVGMLAHEPQSGRRPSRQVTRPEKVRRLDVVPHHVGPGCVRVSVVGFLGLAEECVVEALMGRRVQEVDPHEGGDLDLGESRQDRGVASAQVRRTGGGRVWRSGPADTPPALQAPAACWRQGLRPLTPGAARCPTSSNTSTAPGRRPGDRRAGSSSRASR